MYIISPLILHSSHSVSPPSFLRNSFPSFPHSLPSLPLSHLPCSTSLPCLHLTTSFHLLNENFPSSHELLYPTSNNTLYPRPPSYPMEHYTPMHHQFLLLFLYPSLSPLHLLSSSRFLFPVFSQHIVNLFQVPRHAIDFRPFYFQTFTSLGWQLVPFFLPREKKYSFLHPHVPLHRLIRST